MGQFGNFENRFLGLKLTCGEDYPNVPPTVIFEHKVALPEVNEEGVVDVTALEGCNPWNGVNMGMKDILAALKNSISTHR